MLVILFIKNASRCKGKGIRILVDVRGKEYNLPPLVSQIYVENFQRFIS